MQRRPPLQGLCPVRWSIHRRPKACLGQFLFAAMPGPNSLGTCKWAWYRLAWQLNLKSPSLKPAQSQKWWNEMERNSGIKNNLQNSPAASPSLSPTDSTSYGLHHEGTLLSPTEVRQARPDQRSTINTVKFYRHKMKSNQMEVANDTKISWKQSPKMVSKMAPHWWLNANIGSKTTARWPQKWQYITSNTSPMPLHELMLCSVQLAFWKWVYVLERCPVLRC